MLLISLERSESMSDKPIRPDEFNDKRWEWFEAHLTPEIKNRLYFEALRILRNPQDAEDALGLAYLHAITKLHQLKSEDRFYPWMFTIVRREARHMDAKTARSMSAFLRYKLDCIKPMATPEQQVIDSERKEQLYNAIEQLKSPEKEIVKLRNWENLSLLEIAQKLGLNYHTTRSKYTRAMNSIANQLKGQGGDDSHEEV